MLRMLECVSTELDMHGKSEARLLHIQDSMNLGFLFRLFL